MPAPKAKVAENIVVEDNAIVIMAVGAQTDENLGVRSVQDAKQYLNDAYFSRGFDLQDTHVTKVRDSGTAYIVDMLYVLIKRVA